MPISVRQPKQDDTRANLRFIEQPRPQVNEVDEVLAGLKQTPPRLSPKYFYDETGSGFFETITTLPEYYLTRTEASIFKDNIEEIVSALGVGDIIIEPGSGNCTKARRLLAAARPAAYVPIDISADFLREAATQTASDYPDTEVIAIAADFTQSWDFSDAIPAGRRIVFYPGSTLGNLDPVEARRFFARLAEVIGSDGGILLGIDLHKSAAVLEPAYDDAQGVTAAFNRNMLTVVNAHTGANFTPENWQHEARYNETAHRVEMALVAKSDQAVSIDDEVLSFARGAEIRTEHSHKYTAEMLDELAANSGLVVSHQWLDAEKLFCVALMEPAPKP